MGATDIILRVKGKTLKDAYKSAYDQAIHEHGHNEYNGTISTTEGVIDKTDVLQGLIKEEYKFAAHDEVGAAVQKWIDQALDNTHKWDSVWGAEVENRSAKGLNNKYILVGWAAI